MSPQIVLSLHGLPQRRPPALVLDTCVIILPAGAVEVVSALELTVQGSSRGAA